MFNSFKHTCYEQGSTEVSLQRFLDFEVYRILVFQKELRDEFEQIGTELDQIQRGTQKLRENVKHLPDDGREVELMGKLERLNSKLQEYIKEARTRETLSSALITEEEKLKTKLAEIEAEQVCYYCVCRVYFG